MLLLQLAMARNCCWAVEQPDKSLLIRHKRMDWFANHVAYVPWTRCLAVFAVEVNQCCFWMMLHGSPTPKRTILYSNMREIGMLDLGKLSNAEKAPRTTSETPKLTRNLTSDFSF